MLWILHLHALIFARRPNPFAFCRYKIVSHLHIPRLLKVPYFQRAPRSLRFFSPNSFRLCRCKIPGVGAILLLESKCMVLTPRSPISRCSSFSFPLSTVHQSQVTSHRSYNPFRMRVYMTTLAKLFRMNICIMWVGVGGAPAVAGTPPLRRCRPASGTCSTLRRSR